MRNTLHDPRSADARHVGTSLRAAAVGVLAGALIVTTATGASAAGQTQPQSGAQATLSPSASVQQLIAHADHFAPANAALQPSSAIRIHIDGSTGTVTSALGKVAITATDARDSVVRSQQDGIQALTVLRQGQTTATFAIQLPSGAKMEQSGAGLNIVSSHGATVGKINAPWAVDAAGKRLPTNYTVANGTLVQHVDTAGAAYPVVADPWISYGWYVYANFSPGDVRWLAGYADYFQLTTAACSALGPTPWAVGCALVVGWASINIGHMFKDAAARGQCVDFKFTYGTPSQLVGWSRYYC